MYLFINQQILNCLQHHRVLHDNYWFALLFVQESLHLLPIEKVVPEHDPKYHNIGNFTWEIIEDIEDDIPIKVIFTYPIVDKTLEEVKVIRKQEVSPYRKEKENTIITLDVNGNSVQVSTSREERVLLASKLSAAPDSHNFKFLSGWLEVSTENLQYIVSEIDKVVQAAFDWELAKLQEIDACETIDEVYDVIVRELPEEIQPPVAE